MLIICDNIMKKLGRTDANSTQTCNGGDDPFFLSREISGIARVALFKFDLGEVEA